MKNFAKKDWVLKLLCVGLAIVAWFYVIDLENPNVEMTFKDIDVKVADESALQTSGLSIVSSDKMAVSVVLRGSRKAMQKLAANQINARVSVLEYRAGEATLPILVSVPVYSGVSVTNTVPHDVNVRLDKIIESSKEISIITKNSPKENYVVFNSTVAPARVSLKGPAYLINAIGTVGVELDLTGKSSDFVEKQKYKLFDKQGQEIDSPAISRDVDTVEVSSQIYMKKTVPVTVESFGNFPGNIVHVKNEISPSSVSIIGSDSVISQISEIKAEPINYAVVTSDVELKQKLQIPDGVRLMDSPEIVTIKVSTEQMETRQFEISDIQMVNVPQGKTFKLDGNTVTVQIQARQSLMRTLSAKDLKATVDVSSATAGKNSLLIKVNLPADVLLIGTYHVAGSLN